MLIDEAALARVLLLGGNCRNCSSVVCLVNNNWRITLEELEKHVCENWEGQEIVAE
jgi:hypothetical protein